jgi:hypothetical protein
MINIKLFLSINDIFNITGCRERRASGSVEKPQIVRGIYSEGAEGFNSTSAQSQVDIFCSSRPFYNIMLVYLDFAQEMCSFIELIMVYNQMANSTLCSTDDMATAAPIVTRRTG